MNQKPAIILTMNTLAFTVCFACWMMNGVLVTFLVEHDLYQWSQLQIGCLIGIPVLTGSITRLPVGILTDKYGGRAVYAYLMLCAAAAMFLASFADSYAGFIVAGLGFGLCGASFAVGIAYTSIWFKPERQGIALGIFGAGNAGAALTSLGAPLLLNWLTANGSHLEAWRQLPRLYAASLFVMTVFFLLFTASKKVTEPKQLSLRERLTPLKNIQVWRFGLYYFYVFGGFVALAQWLIPYYVNVYAVSLAMAGLIATCFILPSGVIRTLGGWMSDRWGARPVMYCVYTICLFCSLLLISPQMPIQLFTALIFVIGIMTGIGMAAVYKHIPSYFPDQVGVVGGLVGMIGGLGGFILPTFFGYLMQVTGLWSSAWIFFSILILASLIWMHAAIRKLEGKVESQGIQQMEELHG